MVLHKVVAPLPKMKIKLEGRGALIILALSVVDHIQLWSMMYPDAPEKLSKKDRLNVELDKMK